MRISRPGPGTVRRVLFTTFVVAGAYAVGARLGSGLALGGDQVTPLSPSTGIALAALILVRWRAVPGVALGALTVNLPLGPSGAAVAAIVVGNTVAAVAAVVLIRWMRADTGFRRARDAITFVVAILGGMLISASIGSLALRSADAMHGRDLGATWSMWWVGDTTGAIVFAPAILLIAARLRTRRGMTAPRALELTAILTTIAFGTIALFPAQFPSRFAVFPLLALAAWRFEQTGAALAALVASAAAAFATTHPAMTAQPGLLRRVVTFQGFATTATLAALTFAALIVDRRIAHERIAAAHADLEERVRARTGDLLRALTELERSEGRLSEAQHVARIGSWEWDIETNTATWTDELYRIYGVPRGTPVTFESYLACVHPDDRAMVESVAQRAHADHAPFAFDHRIVRPGGTVAWVQGRGRVVVGASGRAERMLGTAQDVDERKRMEEATQHVREGRARRRQALELNDEIVQGLSVAAYAFHAGQIDRAREAVDATLHAARSMVGELLGEVESDLEIKPGDLQRERAATVFRRTG